MARYKRRAFEATGPFVVRVAFPFNGVMYTAGDYFPHGTIDIRKLRQLYGCRRINFVESEPKTKPESVEEFDWRTLDEQGLLEYAFEQTGTRFRKAERAVKALEDIH